MEILTSPAAMQEWRASHGASVGLVPTMGYLHEGHLSLVQRSVGENDLTVSSIFVNPTQFGPGEDFERYPRNEEGDLKALRTAGVTAVYMPDAAAMYPPGYQTYVMVEELTQVLEGASRPTHFRGVTTIVSKLFNAVQPTRAYFGRKDAQQLRVIRRMVRDLDMPVEVVGCPIVREADGLAMSSRNVYLTEEERRAAPVLSRALFAARDAWRDGVREAELLREMVRGQIAAEPLAALDYISLADDETLEEASGRIERPALLSIAVRFGKTRLIDNMELD